MDNASPWTAEEAVRSLGLPSGPYAAAQIQRHLLNRAPELRPYEGMFGWYIVQGRPAIVFERVADKARAYARFRERGLGSGRYELVGIEVLERPPTDWGPRQARP